MHPLDKAIWAALSGPQTAFSEGGSLARRFRTEVSPFGSAADASAASIAALGALVPEDGELWLLEPALPAPPPGIEIVIADMGVQLIAQSFRAEGRAPAIEELGEADAEEMRALALLTKPGPFLPRTHTLGRFLGVRENGRIIAMAGERLKPEGFIEISAVCTHPDYRGRGLGASLTRAVGARILADGLTPFLHTYAANAGAIALYQRLGFAVRCEVPHAVWRRAHSA